MLVTGAGGFIGSHVVDALLADGWRVRAFVRYTSTGGRGFLDRAEVRDDPRLEVVLGDVRDPELVDRAVAGCSHVAHLAALIGIPYSYAAPRQYAEVNVVGTLNVLEACRRHKVARVVHTSTSEVYGSAQYVPIDERHPLVGQSPYAASKIGADKVAESYHLSFDIPVVTLRPFNTFGPRQSQRAVIPTVVAQLLAHPDWVELGAVDTLRDFTYVGDTAAGFVAALGAPGAVGQTINLGTGQAFSIKDVVDKVATRLGARPEVRRTETRTRPERSEVRRLVSDNRRARELLGWAPRTSFDEGLARVIEHLRASPARADAFVA